jgi:hypothetical protein
VASLLLAGTFAAAACSSASSGGADERAAGTPVAVSTSAAAAVPSAGPGSSSPAGSVAAAVPSAGPGSSSPAGSVASTTAARSPAGSGDAGGGLAAWCRAATTAAVGTVRDPALDEISGIAVGRRDPSVRWVHNDSGGGPVLFALAPDGALLATVTIDGVTATDWEDIAAGPGPVDGEPWLFVADIGDNGRVRPSVSVVRFVEPALPVRRVAGQTVEVVYPDGPHDAEAFFVHPVSGDWYVLTKETAQSSVLFRVPRPGMGVRRVTPEVVGYLDVRPDRVTAADLSPDGTRLAVRTYSGVRVFPVVGDDVAGALGASPCRFNVPGELQGEAVAFEADGRSLVTVAEGNTPELRRTG